ncbi:nickel ABC transporter permease [Proteinivorax hydrogeniformans]|uniref:Nickel import system permease protein NikB n=1 Tax=Proteinivorax hydrogeniformans TaxID=1826727 RepID=A0AAU8HT58_9FIRM
MLKYIGRRLLLLLPVLLGVSFIVFTLMHITPGNPAAIRLGEQATAREIEQLEEQMGLNDPFLLQYTRFVSDIVIRQDFGRSYQTGTPVIESIFSRFPNTVTLAGLGVLVAVVIGVPVGIISATKQYSLFDNVAMVLALLGVSMPNFWQGMLLILIFSVHLGMFPPSGFATPMHWVLPAVALGTSSAAMIARMTRSSMLEVIKQDYIRTARAKGQKESVVIYRHALKNALIPVVTVVGLQFGYLLGGAVLTETVFSINGVGRLMVDAINQRDFPVVQGGVLFIALTFSLINLLVDILYAFIDPRIKAQYK